MIKRRFTNQTKNEEGAGARRRGTSYLPKNLEKFSEYSSPDELDQEEIISEFHNFDFLWSFRDKI